jgi:hypothetical protein
MNYHEFFQKLASDDGRNFKIDLLEHHKDDNLLREIVRLALDPLVQFYQRKIPDYTPAKPNQADSLSSVIDSLYILSTRQVTGNAAIDFLTKLLSSLTEDDARVLEKIISKDLRCGVSVSTANKVWPNLVMDYPCMLCSQFEQKLVDKIQFPAYVQMKMDGMRFNAIVRNGTVEFRSRNGKELYLLGELEQEFLALASGVNCVFDGELMVMMPGDMQFADRQTGNGILNKANKGTIGLDQAKMVHASLWDVIPLDDFMKGTCNVPYETRWNTVLELVNKQDIEGKRIWHVFNNEVPNVPMAQDMFRILLSEGHEGIILKDKKGIWENKRTKSQIKFKAELECDLEVIGYEEGTGKYAGKLGALVCQSGHQNGKHISVSVGSGFNDADRDNLWSDRDSLIGKIVAVKYNERITNKQGEESLFLPIYVEMREDKNEPDSIKDIK